MKIRMLAAVAAFLVSVPVALAQQSATPAAAAPEKRPFTELPYTPSLEPSFLDRGVEPCTDLYTFSCGGWMKQNPIPPDQSQWSVYGKAHDENQQYLWGILEEAARPDPGRSPRRQKVGDYFAACMDEGAVEKLGASPLKPDLDAIATLRSIKDLPRWLASAHLRIGSYEPALFGFGAAQDPGNSEKVIAWADAGGLGLPDRDYYTKTDPRSVEIRKRYASHVATMLGMIGESGEQAAKDAGTVMRIETALARASLTLVEKRDPYKTYHKMPVEKLQKLTPSFSWKDYLEAGGAGAVRELNVTEPGFFKALEAGLRREGLDAWKAYLRWHLLKDRAEYLSSPFAKADFDFYRGFLRGVKEQQPRWKRCVAMVDDDLGEALGQVFVEKIFPPETRAKALDMALRIEKAMKVRTEGLDWMSNATKREALLKLSTVRNKIGYPEKWRDYSALEIRRGDFAGNVERASVFESRRQIAKIGKPVDRDEWGMTPPTVNAYYDSAMNDINFPAGVLLPPLYDARLDDAPNYGNTGGTIGHELIHGFDDEGRQYDAGGNLRDWWSGADKKEFDKRVSCIADQYAQYVVVDDIKINSRLTLGEDVADLGGTILAWLAWKDATAGQSLESRDGLTPEQRFFVGNAQWACANERPEDMRLRAMTDPHSPPAWRVNGLVPNVPEFAKAFACKPGQPMVKENVCRIW